MTDSTALAADATPSSSRRPAATGKTRRQILGIARLELRRQLLGGRAWITYFLAGAPTLLMLMWPLSPVPKELAGPLEATPIYSGFFVGFLSSSIFLACLVQFMSLFRSEIIEKSLHYYFLTPLRREVLVVAKYLSALLVTTTVFLMAVAASFLLCFSPWGLGELGTYLVDGPGLRHLVAYLGVTALACVGYGAVFLLLGQLFRNPVVPAAVLWAWEAINFLLPAWLKKLSVIFYLKSLLPVPVDDGAFAVLTEPTPWWLSVPGLMLFTVAVLALAAWRARTMEATYGAD
ncbi:MAG: hypothetical protein AAGN46_02810 [Acidobacteriota bacterium]